jgi:2-isopropylmalate synthase
MRLSSDLSRIVKGDLPLDFNWNSDSHPDSPIPKKIPTEPKASQLKKIIIDDEGLRDGLHGVPEYPALSSMLSYIKTADNLKIKLMTVGIYSGNGVVDKTTKKLLKEMKSSYPHISPIVLSLATEDSLRWAGECKKLNPKLQVIVFMGSAPSRMLVEGWTKEFVLSRLSWAVKRAVSTYKLTVIGATEHTTQTPPDFLRKIIKTQVKAGAKFFCIADTIGVARPVGAFRLVKFVKKVLKSFNASHVLVDWHGHRDIGFSLSNCMAAVAAGADRVHLVPYGIGERSGNAPLEHFLINACQILTEAGIKPRWELSKLTKLLAVYAEITGNRVPSYGCLGKRSFYTNLGIHAAAILKAEELAREASKKGHSELVPKLKRMARKVYAGIDPYILGRGYQIGIGPYSGASTVKLWAMNRNLREPSKKSIKKVLDTTKNLRRILKEKEIYKLINGKLKTNSS